MNLINTIDGIEPGGTWFEMEMSNQINSDYIYIGCVTPDGSIKIFNQDGVDRL